MFRNFKMVSRVIFGRGCFNQMGDILAEKRSSNNSFKRGYLLDSGIYYM